MILASLCALAVITAFVARSFEWISAYWLGEILICIAMVLALCFMAILGGWARDYETAQNLLGDGNGEKNS